MTRPASMPARRTSPRNAASTSCARAAWTRPCASCWSTAPSPASVCGHVCPNLCQTACTRNQLDDAIQIGALGRLSVHAELPVTAPSSGRSVGVIGGGVGGLSAAWQLAHKGHAVTVYEADEDIGGKLRQVIPHARLVESVLAAELQRIREAGVTIRTGCRVDAEQFAALRKEHDALIVATGGHKARVFPWPGKERLVAGIDFLKAVNRGESPAVPERVVVIGCGNAGMDVAAGAFACGATEVTCVDVQKPAAFAHEMAHIEALGGKIVWPVRTKEITEQGLVDEEGRLFPADMIIISVGETPELDFVPETAPRFRDWLAPRRRRQRAGRRLCRGRRGAARPAGGRHRFRPPRGRGRGCPSARHGGGSRARALSRPGRQPAYGLVRPLPGRRTARCRP